MKANEAPEELYLHPTVKGNVGVSWLTFPLTNEDIEYTRTDAFIEKATKFLYDYNKNMVKKHGARAVLGCSEFTINVYDFKKYMEGE